MGVNMDSKKTDIRREGSEQLEKIVPTSQAAALPILPVRKLVAFPQMHVPFMISLTSTPLIESAMKADRLVGLLTIKDETTEDPVPGQLYEVGTIGKIVETSKNDDGMLVALVTGLSRFRVSVWHTDGPFLRADIVHAPEIVESGLEMDALQRELRTSVKEVLSTSPNAEKEAVNAINTIQDPVQLVYTTAFNMTLTTEVRQSLLELDSVRQKIRALLTYLSKEKEMLDIGEKIRKDVKAKMSKSQRDFYLRQQLEAIKSELGEDREPKTETDSFRERLSRSDMPDEAREEAIRELERLQQMTPQSAEYPMIKTYLGWLLDLPWGRYTRDTNDIPAARRILAEDHYGLRDVKERLIEHLAVRNIVEQRGKGEPEETDTSAMGVILCLVGPPGVGKTSLGRSVARALGREFTRMSLGGVRDEAEIRGHRRTYIGAMPGRIIQAIKRAGSQNPVFMLDEIDKVGQDWRGDPSSALLEVLDPAQNNTFRDHYLDVDFDLSKVMFIATANQLDTIPGPLRDRMEIIQLDGYTADEKFQIAKRHLIPRQLKAHRLTEEELTIMDETTLKLIYDYTKEAGVRNLERRIAATCRKAIVKLTENGWYHVVVTAKMIREFLKKEHFESEPSETIDMPGVATGLAVTSVGGDILYIEASKMPGKGRLSMTGQLGNVMKESAQIAFSYVRAKSETLGIDPEIFDNVDVHLHVPAGALPKDGPSAGVAMVITLASLFGDKPVRSDIGITGEITLRGRVLPVGGIKMKALAAHRAELKIVILPKRNQKDLDELPEEVRSNIEFITVDRIDEAIDAAFAPPLRQCTRGKWANQRQLHEARDRADGNGFACPDAVHEEKQNS